MVQNNQLTYRNYASQLRQAGVHFVFAGLLFVIMGGMFIQFIGADFGRYLGAIFIVLGVLVFIRGVGNMWASGSYTKLAIDASDRHTNSNLEQYR